MSAKKLILKSTSPILSGLVGTLKLEALGIDQAARLIKSAAESGSIVSQISYQSTCDILAALAGLSGVHRYNRDRDTRETQLADGDCVLIVTLREHARGKSQYALGAIDFDFTLATFSAVSR